MAGMTQACEGDWFIARCLHGTDKHALDVLKRNGVTTWYPMIVDLKPMPLRRLSHAQRLGGHAIMRPVPSPMLPRYVFIQEPRRAAAYFQEAGIGGFITCDGERVVCMRPAELARIRRQENGGMIDGKKTTRVVFDVGDPVTIASGPFAQFQGVVDKGLDVPIAQLDPTARIKIAIAIFGRTTLAEFEIWQVALQT